MKASNLPKEIKQKILTDVQKILVRETRPTKIEIIQSLAKKHKVKEQELFALLFEEKSRFDRKRNKEQRNIIIRKRLQQGDSFHDLAAEYGISSERIRQIDKDAESTYADLTPYLLNKIYADYRAGKHDCNLYKLSKVYNVRHANLYYHIHKKSLRKHNGKPKSGAEIPKVYNHDKSIVLKLSTIKSKK